MPIRNKSGQLVENENLSAPKQHAPVDMQNHVRLKLAAMCRVTNRGKYCRADYNADPAAPEPKTDHYFVGTFNSENYPSDFDPSDVSTGLLPGEHMDVPMDVALSLFGFVFEPPDADEGQRGRIDLINKYGGQEYDDSLARNGNASARSPQMIPVDMPRMPDILLQQVNQRGRLIGEQVSFLEYYLTTNSFFLKRKRTVDGEKLAVPA